MERLTPTRKIVEEIEAIIKHANIFSKVGIGIKSALTQEDTFPSCYLKVEGTTAEINGNLSVAKGCEYDRGMVLRIVMYIELNDDLDFLDYQDKVEKAILEDNPLWAIIVDRDFIGSEWDNDSSYPRKEGEVAFLIKWRSDV